MQQILIVEDIAEVRRALAAIAAEAFPGARLEEATTLAAARAFLRQGAPDLVLLDLGLPDGNGVEIARDFGGGGTTIVVTTIFEDDEHLFEALRAGASGYLLKDEPHQALVDALRGISDGRPPLSPSIARRILQYFRPAPSASTPLSPRETEVLTLIARGYTVRDVAAALHMSYNTAAGHLKSIYHKLSVNSRAEAAMEAVRLGIVRAP